MTAPPRIRQVLLLCSDEHDPRHSGFGGSTVVHTPHLDRLAARASVFDNAWTPSPICVPARASLATGRYVHQHRYWDNALAYDGAIPSWAHRLQQAGIGVESVGKLHYRSAADDTGFDCQTHAMHISGGRGQVWGSVRDPLPEVGRPASLFRELGAGESDYNRFDVRVAEHAVNWLTRRAQQRDAQPAALFVGLVAPHFPLVVPEKWLDQYHSASLPWPRMRPETGYVRHPWVERMARFAPLDDELASDERRRLAIASYFGLVSFMDAQMGRILDALDALDLADETLVIYLSDHGDNLGTRGLWNKSLLYRESTGIPLLMAGPGAPQRRCTINVSLIDIFPTVLDALGVPLDPRDVPLPGISLLTLAARENESRVVLSEYHAIGSPSAAFMVTDGHYKYHHYVGFDPELFDLRNDPDESRNLAALPSHIATTREFEGRLREYLDPERVDRSAKDDQNNLVARMGGRENALHIGKSGATPVP